MKSLNIVMVSVKFPQVDKCQNTHNQDEGVCSSGPGKEPEKSCLV